jgi:hypothetical protein
MGVESYFQAFPNTSGLIYSVVIISVISVNINISGKISVEINSVIGIIVSIETKESQLFGH